MFTMSDETVHSTREELVTIFFRFFPATRHVENNGQTLDQTLNAYQTPKSANPRRHN